MNNTTAPSPESAGEGLPPAPKVKVRVKQQAVLQDKVYHLKGQIFETTAERAKELGDQVEIVVPRVADKSDAVNGVPAPTAPPPVTEKKK
jgi:hypothetical protein